MQSNQKSQFKKLVATGKISKRFPQDGWTQEMFDKDFACHSQRMLRIRGHVDASLPRTLADPPPWLNKSPGASRSRARRQKQKHAPPPWVVSESRNASNIPDQRDFRSASVKMRGRRRRAKAAVVGEDAGASAAGTTRVDFAAGRIRARPQRHQQRPRVRPSTAKPLTGTGADGQTAGAAAAARPRTSDGHARTVANGRDASAENAAITRVLRHPDAPLYALDEDQRRTFNNFTAMLAQFDTYAMLDMLEDALHDAQDKTLLEDYFGADETA